MWFIFFFLFFLILKIYEIIIEFFVVSLTVLSPLQLQLQLGRLWLCCGTDWDWVRFRCGLFSSSFALAPHLAVTAFRALSPRRTCPSPCPGFHPRWMLMVRVSIRRRLLQRSVYLLTKMVLRCCPGRVLRPCSPGRRPRREQLRCVAAVAGLAGSPPTAATGVDRASPPCGRPPPRT